MFFHDIIQSASMAAKVRELIDDTVWSDKPLAIISNEVREILDVHVWYMIQPGCVVRDLYEWTSEQIMIHNAKGSKIQAIIDQMNTLDSAGITKLRNHHWRIANNYHSAGMEIVLFLRKI
jgi:hypothetical protein